MTKRIFDPQISAKRIRDQRKELGITQEELAKKANIAKVTLKKYEGGTRVPQEDMRKNLARALGVSEEWLVGESDDKNLIDALSKDKLYAKYFSLFNREDMRFYSELAAYDDEIEEEVGYMISHTGTDITVTKHFSAEEMQGFYEKTYAAIVDLFKDYKESD